MRTPAAVLFRIQLNQPYQEGIRIMQWERPAYIELNMSSEIGAYQDDFTRTDRGRMTDLPVLHSDLPEGLLQTGQACGLPDR